jgi:hypothetical protein
MANVPRTSEEMHAAFVEDLAILKSLCASFDRGEEGIGKVIAGQLRKILITKGSSKAQIDHRDLRGIRFHDSSGPLNPENPHASQKLALTEMIFGSTAPPRHVPACYVEPAEAPRWISFDEWLENAVLLDTRNVSFSRRDLILKIAEQHDGVHSDAKLEENYSQLSLGNSMGMLAGRHPDLPAPLQGRLPLVCIRQIAYEVLDTLHQVPEFREFADPTPSVPESPPRQNEPAPGSAAYAPITLTWKARESPEE